MFLAIGSRAQSPEPRNGNANSNVRLIYEYLPLGYGIGAAIPLSNTVQVLSDGKIEGSDSAKAQINITPNPIFNNATLFLNSAELGEYSCILLDVEGKMIQTYQFKKDQQYLQQILPMYSVPKGDYVLQVKSKNFSENIRIVKQ